VEVAAALLAAGATPTRACLLEACHDRHFEIGELLVNVSGGPLLTRAESVLWNQPLQGRFLLGAPSG
jgi:hypothetical protein